MKPHVKLAEARTPEGARLTLHAHDGNFCIRLNGQELMHSAAAASERQLGELAVARLTPRAEASVFIGGLGLGFTLCSVLARVGKQTTVKVAELVPEIVSWNRTFMAGLNGACLDDARVEITVADAGAIIGRATAAFDAIVLDVDNGPTAMVQTGNSRLYDPAGLRRIARALRRGGRLVVWSARADREFAARLAAAGFAVTAVPAKVHANARRSAYMIYVADKAS